jgi:hypothetical protein
MQAVATRTSTLLAIPCGLEPTGNVWRGGAAALHRDRAVFGSARHDIDRLPARTEHRHFGGLSRVGGARMSTTQTTIAIQKRSSQQFKFRQTFINGNDA